MAIRIGYLIEIQSNRDNYQKQLNNIDAEVEENLLIATLNYEYQDMAANITLSQTEHQMDTNNERINLLQDSNRNLNNRIQYYNSEISFSNNTISNIRSSGDEVYYEDELNQHNRNLRNCRLSIDESNLAIANNNMQINEIRYQSNISERNYKLAEHQKLISKLQYVQTLESIEEKKEQLQNFVNESYAEYLKVAKIKNKLLTSKKKLIQKEKALPCDYIVDESGTKLAFDFYGKLVEISDSYGNKIEIVYQDDFLTKVITADEKTILFEYNDDGWLDKITDHRGRVTHFVYGGSRSVRLSEIVYPEDGTLSNLGNLSTQFSYLSNGRLSSIVDRSGYAVGLSYLTNEVKISSKTYADEISDGNIVSMKSATDGEVDAESIDDTISVKRIDMYTTEVSSGDVLTVYQFDNAGNILSVYHEDPETGLISDTAASEYNGKNRTFSVHSDMARENLIANGDFSSLNKWNVVGTAEMDSSNYEGGTGCLRLTSGYNINARVSQSIAIHNTTKHFLLSLWAKANSWQIQSERRTGYEKNFAVDTTSVGDSDEEATRKFGIKAIVLCTNDTREVFYASFNWHNTDWQLCQLPIRVSGIPDYIIVSFEYGYNNGDALIDGFRLTDEYGVERELTDDGKIVWESDGKLVKSFEYDGGANPVKKVETDDQTWWENPNMKYYGNLECQCIPEETYRVTRYFYDANNKVTMEESYDGMVTEYEYDENGLMIKSACYHRTDPTSKFYTHILRDSYGREVKIMDERGEVNGESLSVSNIYNTSSSLLKTQIGAGGTRTEYGYSHITDDLVSIAVDDNGMEHTSRFNYTAGYITALDNSSNICYNYTYDGFGRVKQVDINGDNLMTVEYDVGVSGQKKTDIKTVTLANNEKLTTSNGRGGKYFETKYTSAQMEETVLKQSLDFDNSGKCLGYVEFPNSDQARLHELEYNNEGQISKHTTDVGSTSYFYDFRNRPIIKSHEFRDGDAHDYVYTYRDGVESDINVISSSLGLVQNVKRDKQGRMSGMVLTNTNGTEMYARRMNYLKYGDHATHYVSDIRHKIGPLVDDTERYVYDNSGNISKIIENGTLKVKYTYDKLNRLIREDNKDLGKTVVFVYDNGGNILKYIEYPYTLKCTDELGNGQEHNYVYTVNRSDRLLSFDRKVCSYDAIGCPAFHKNILCTYTRGGLLAGYGDHTFTYDADGIRLKKNNIVYTYIDGTLTRQKEGTLALDFIYGIDGIIGIKYDGTVYYFRKNLMGDVTHIYNANYALQARYVYDAWGNHKIVDESGNEITDTDNIGLINPIRYRGYYYDTETGLYYLKARYYDPETCRFISQDDISFLAPNHITGLNLFAYCNNNPINDVDFNGNIGFLAALGIAILIGAAIGATTGAVMGGAAYAIDHTSDFSWQGFGAAVAGGAVSGLITGGVAGAMSIIGGPATGVFVAYTLAGAVGGFAGSMVESAINGKDLLSIEVIGTAVVDATWGAIGGAIGGLMQGSITPIRAVAQQSGNTLQYELGRVVAKTAKEIGPSLGCGVFSDFINWYMRFCTEGVYMSYTN